MNALKTAFQLQFKLVNPYKIKSQMQILSSPSHILKNNSNSDASFPQSKPDIDRVSAILINNQKINYDCHILRFRFADKENQDKCLGLKIGQSVQIEYKGDRRKYVPISRIDDSGTVDFLLRDMRAKLGPSTFSSRLTSISEGEKVTLIGPYTSFLYHGYGHVETATFNRKFKRIGVIAYETGITATYSLIESIYANQDSETAVSLLWVGEKMEDFVFLEELGYLVEQSKLSMNVMLRRYEKGFPGPYGELNQGHFRDYLPQPDDDTVLFLTGTTEQTNNMRGMAQQLGYRFIV